MFYLFADSETQERVKMDILQYQIQYNDKRYDVKYSVIRALNYILASDLAFRSVFAFRIKSKWRKVIFSIFWRPLKTIEIACHDPNGTIEGGLWISHNYCVLHVWSAGRNLRVGPGVTIGMKNNGANIINPIIGNDVYVGTNSTIIGGIRIGNNSTIGAGSVVTKSIPENAVVCGNPARIMKYKVESS